MFLNSNKMNFKKISLSLFAGLFGIAGLNAQLLYNGGTKVAVTGGGVLYVDGAVENTTGGLFSNAGYTTVKGYFRNGGTATGGGAAGVYYVLGDWENNNTFTADQSNVVLNGVSQNITGSQATTFYNLTLRNAGSVKTQTIDASVTNTDSLNDCEQATGDFNLNILNTSAADGIQRVTGFVSSTGPGRLTRATNSTNTYLFPTGWNDNGNTVYRPVEMTPVANDNQTFNVRFAYDNPTGEGYDTAVKADVVNLVNGKFFHLIKQVGATSAADMTIYYDPSVDGSWSSIGRWQTVPQWEDLTNTTVSTSSPLVGRTKSNWTDNGHEPHALINAELINTLWNFPNVFNPASNDPLNATFHIIDKGAYVTVTAMRIFDRWGEIVFDSQRDGTMRNYYGANTYAWDGTYEGKTQTMGNYVYTATIKVNETGATKTVSGNIALVR